MGFRKHFNRVDFNQYRDTYREEIKKAISFTGIDMDFFTEVKANRLLRIAGALLITSKRMKALLASSGCPVLCSR